MKLHARPSTFVTGARKGCQWQAEIIDDLGELYCVTKAPTAAKATLRANQIISNRSKVGELVNRVKRMNEALVPFLAYVATLSETLPDDAPITNGLRGKGKITAGECRALVRSAQR